MSRFYPPNLTVAQFALMLTEDHRVAVAAAHSRANEMRDHLEWMKSRRHPHYGESGHQRAVQTSIREVEQEAGVLGRDLQRLRTLIDLLLPYVTQIAEAGG